MNANELADELDNLPSEYLMEAWMYKAQTVLRDQHLRIEQLLETQDYLYKIHDADKAEIEAFKNKECSCNVNTVNNEPIAVFIPAPLRYDEWKRRFALHWVDGEPIGITHLYSEDLVRQQQAEIEALEASKDRLIKTLLHVRGQQPVAYVNKYADGKEILDNGTDLTAEDSIPLYTHLVKELTDEEIAVIGDKCFGTMSYELWLQTNEFARAILRKAQEKC